MTAPLDLSPIEDRDAHAECVDICHQPQADRRALLAEVKRLRAQIVAAREFAEHLIADAPALLQADCAQAWDEGVATALNHAIRNDDEITLRLEHLDGRPWVNPYRREAEAPMTDPLTHPGQLCTSGDRAVDLALELGRARVRLERIRALVAEWEKSYGSYDHDDEHAAMQMARRHILVALDEPEPPP